MVSDDVTTAGFQTSRQFRNCRWSIALSLRRNTTPALLQAASASHLESPWQLTLMLPLTQHVCSRSVAKPAFAARPGLPTFYRKRFG